MRGTAIHRNHGVRSVRQISEDRLRKLRISIQQDFGSPLILGSE
jgi:hypothetical protein